MGRKQQLLKYFNKLSPEEKDIAIGKVAEVNKGRMVELKTVKLAESVFSSAENTDQRHPQKVTRRGIKVNGKEYRNDDLISGYLGRTVNVVVTPDEIRVEDMDKKVIATFTTVERITYHADIREVGQALRNLRCQHSQS